MRPIYGCIPAFYGLHWGPPHGVWLLPSLANSFIQVHLLLLGNLQSSCPHYHFSCSFLTSAILAIGNREPNLDTCTSHKCFNVAKYTRADFPGVLINRFTARYLPLASPCNLSWDAQSCSIIRYCDETVPHPKPWWNYSFLILHVALLSNSDDTTGN